jgi:uncharacterized membrane protein
MFVETVTTIDAPVEQVFNFLTDTDFQPQFDRSLLEVSREPAGPMRQGTTITEVRTMMGQKIETHYEVAEYEPYRRFVGKSIDGNVSGVGTRLFEAVNGGTQITWRFDMQPQGILALASPLFGRVLRRSMERDLALAKSLLESGAWRNVGSSADNNA